VLRHDIVFGFLLPNTILHTFSLSTPKSHI
jgi:hypothetical protein